MNSLLQRLYARYYDPVMAAVEREGLGDLRAGLLGDLSGEVVEIGAGTGVNLAHYGRAVIRVVAVEPSPPMAQRLQTRAEARADGDGAAAGRRDGDRADGHHLDVEVVVAPAERLPLPDASADAVVTTLVLCSVRDVATSVAEARRVLRPGGRLVLLEHVAGDGRLGRVQRFVQPVYGPLAGGCHLSRDPLATIAAAGFAVDDVRRVELPMPPLARPGLIGTARVTA